MIIRGLLILHYLVFCFRFLTIPWRYFQLNARYFNNTKKIFSKQDLDAITPVEWRLNQYIDNTDVLPEHYPVFAKPEWGQNSTGVSCIHNYAELKALRESPGYQVQNYLIQEAATGSIEFEVFVVKDPQQANQFSVMSITQVINSSTDKFPVNGIYNTETQYQDITEQLSSTEQQALWQELSRMGDFTIARYSLKADSLVELLQRQFKLVEVNLYVPMPLSLLSYNLTRLQKYQLLYKTTHSLAQLAQQLNSTKVTQGIFFNKLIAAKRGRHTRILNQDETNKTSNLQMDQ
ncbi:hypothetical protein HWV00_05005 [Moritella sp. 24]|uniref:hypothetical protein n=1 Tax=Moritella sp. 24 TaxID=2746230 RepID=UPI001BA60C47|nr:hypothetical protein [Moritella sp. 24]QUM75644.1 hypothetical protein HWV00_05005 [Moritella sp. 24]